MRAHDHTLPNQTTTQPAALLLSSTTTDHFHSVHEALHRHNITTHRTLTHDANGNPTLPPNTRVLAVADAEAPDTRRAIRLAIDARIPVIQLMDGLVDARNTLTNPANAPAGVPNFLRPAPAGLVLCATEADRIILEALGNTARATGLPRLDPITPTPPPAAPRLLVATARTPAFNPAERDRLVRTLERIRDAAEHFNLPITWRLTARLDLELNITNTAGPLADALATCTAVLTTPSTLALEARRAGRPVALIDPHDTPAWVRADALWRTGDPVTTDRSAALRAAESELNRRFPMRTFRGAGGLWRLIRTLADEPRSIAANWPDQPADQPAIQPTTAAEAVAHAIAEQAHAPTAFAPCAPQPRSAPTPTLAPAASRRRVVHLYATEGPPLGGVPVWCERLSNALNHTPDLGWESRVLAVTARRYETDAHHVCVIDPSAGPAAAVRTVAESLRRLHPDAVVPHYADVCHAAAAALRPEGVRTIAAMNTLDDAARALIDTYSGWDAAVGVSAACEQWLTPRANNRPIATIPYGVPIADQPRTISDTQHDAGPLRIAYVGRMVELQKRISDLHAVVEGLDRRGVRTELHLVGDGPDLDRFLARERATARQHVTVRAHGPRPAGWVQHFWPTIDAAVLVSEAEGMSISMLEAMGHGVVPIVTAVESGATEAIEDGINGHLVRIGDTEAMADRLARLAADRDHLRTLSAAAHRTARERAHTANAARSWALLLDTAVASPSSEPGSWADDTACRAIEPWRWKGAHSEDPATDLAWIESTLAAAGFKSIARDTPGHAADAVIVTAAPTPDTLARVAEWRARGLGVALAPNLIEPEWVRLAGAVRRAHRDGATAIAVYGCGDHTNRAARAFAWARERGIPVVGLIDDEPRTDAMFGLPVVPRDQARSRLGADAIVLSSDAWEHTMWANLADLRDAGVRTYALYRSGDADPPADRDARARETTDREPARVA